MEGDETKTSVVKKAERKLPPHVSNVAVNRTGDFGSHEFYKEKEEEKRQKRLKECKVGGEGAVDVSLSFLVSRFLLVLSSPLHSAWPITAGATQEEGPRLQLHHHGTGLEHSIQGF